MKKAYWQRGCTGCVYTQDNECSGLVERGELSSEELHSFVIPAPTTEV